jgi:Cu-Zn family superoxide dismutase
MYYKSLILIPALLCPAAALGQRTSKPAHADIINPQGQKIGTAKIFAAKEGVNIEVNASHLPPGTHGVHIHNVGKCDGADSSAGPHLNPYTKKHGKDKPEGPRAGDLLNLKVNAAGIAKVR